MISSVWQRQAQTEQRRRRSRGAVLQHNARAPSFRAFVQNVAPHYQMYRHCNELISVLQRVADGDLNRLMVFLPPRHSKSETVSRLFPAYYLARHPDRFVGLTSYGAELAYTLSRSARDYYGRSGRSMRGDAAAVKHWETGQGGGLWAAGVGGAITGRGFQLGIIDDPLKDAEQAASTTIREKQKDWYASTFSTRQEPGAAIVIVQTRWHDDDLSGHLLALEADEPERWHIVNLPALAPDTPPAVPATCTLHPDWRQPDTALCPEHYDADKLQRIQRRIGLFYFAALYQQSPRPRQGGMFDRANVTILDTMPAGVVRRVRYWDKAGADVGKGDYTVGVLMAYLSDGRSVIEDVVRGQWTAASRNAVIRQTAQLDRERGHVAHWIEQPPGLGKEATDAVLKELTGFAAFADPVRGDKVERAEPFAAQWEAGNVALLRGAWNRAYLDELEAFPRGTNDDQVDASSGAFRKIAHGRTMTTAVGGQRTTVQGYQPR